MTEIYLVGGMTCSHCAETVTNAIKTRETGADVSVDLESGKVEVAAGPDEAAIIEAVKDAGFEYKGAA